MQFFSGPQIILYCGTFLLAIGKFIDAYLTDEWRTRLAHFLTTGSIRPLELEPTGVKPWQFAAETIASFFRDTLRSHDIRHFLLVSASASITIITLAFLYFYLRGDTYDQNDVSAIFVSGKSIFLALIFH